MKQHRDATTRKLIGVCQVETGQVMIVDPCFLRQWQGSGTEQTHDVFRDKKTGKKWVCAMHTADVNIPSDYGVFASFADPIPECGNQCPNDLVAQKKWKREAKPRCKHEFSDTGCFRAISDNDYVGGQLNYPQEAMPIAVAVKSGIGDGTYPVYAHVDADGFVHSVEVRFL